MTERRRTDRVFLRIPTRVQGLDLRGEYFSERTTTVEVNRDGARIELKSPLRMGDELRVTNLITGATALCRVTVECLQSYGELPEWGIALSTSMSDVVADFWGITFEDLPEEPQPHISALLSCTGCGRRELVTISHVEYDVLREDLVLPRVCQTCRTATDWEPVDLTRPWPPPPGEDPSRHGGAGEPESMPPGSGSSSAGRRSGSGATPGPQGDEGRLTEPASRIDSTPETSAGAAERGPDRPGPHDSAAGRASSAGIHRGVQVEERPAGGKSGSPTLGSEVPRNGTPELARPEVSHRTATGREPKTEEGERRSAAQNDFASQTDSLRDGAAGDAAHQPALDEVNPDVTSTGSERRVLRRVPVRVPILVQAPNGTTEETTTRDVSKTGLSFPTSLDLSKGDSIEVVVGYGVVAAPVRQKARVAWRRPDTQGARGLVGVHFTGTVEPQR